MKKLKFLVCTLMAGSLFGQMEEPMVKAVDFAANQMRSTLNEMGYGGRGINPDWLTAAPEFPKVTGSGSGEVDWDYQSRTANWGAGYTPGLLWDLYSLTGNDYWLEKADAFTDGMEPTKNAGGDMQMNIGFHMMNSYARRQALAPVEGDRAILRTAAERLLEAWMPEVGSLYSFTWNRGFRFDGLQGGWSNYENTIIDSAPNLEILFYEARQSGDVDMWQKALSHLSNLIRDNIRADGSTAQLASYDVATGEFLGPRGHQGYSHASTWSRGQGWALHGFATAWRETGDAHAGETFHRLYRYYRENCPADGIPYWDFDAPGLTDAELAFRYPDVDAAAIRLARDTSAAALAASALLQACQLAETPSLAWEYYAYGVHILRNLCEPGYLAMDAEGNALKASILRQGSYTFPGVDKGQIWGDFYFVEALRRYRDLVEPALVFDEKSALGDLTHYTFTDTTRWRVAHDLGDPALRLQGRSRPPATVPVDMALYEPAAYADFSAKFFFRSEAFVPDGGQGDAVMVFGYVDRFNYHYLRLSTDGLLSGIYTVVNGEAAGFEPLDQAWSGTGYHEVKFSRLGGSLQVEVDGLSWGQVESAHLGVAGRLGLAGMGQTTLYDSLEITGSATPVDGSPFKAWQEEHFSHVTGFEAASAADPDADGFPNLLEYVHGTDPLQPDGGAFPQLEAVVGSNGLSLAFSWNASRTDIRYRVMRSTNGIDWEERMGVTPSGEGDWEEASLALDEPADLNALYRLEISVTP